VILQSVDTSLENLPDFYEHQDIEKCAFSTHKKRPRDWVEECIYPLGLRERPIARGLL